MMNRFVPKVRISAASLQNNGKWTAKTFGFHFAAQNSHFVIKNNSWTPYYGTKYFSTHVEDTKKLSELVNANKLQEANEMIPKLNAFLNSFDTTDYNAIISYYCKKYINEERKPRTTFPPLPEPAPGEPVSSTREFADAVEQDRLNGTFCSPTVCNIFRYYEHMLAQKIEPSRETFMLIFDAFAHDMPEKIYHQWKELPSTTPDDKGFWLSTIRVLAVNHRFRKSFRERLFKDDTTKGGWTENLGL
jgi:hypothetical protein